ncbi:hypothetical protein GGE09_004694 [Roseobacter sp. N2S]|nr:hypothetical protein [Roseobacter sp. N2S]
MINKISQSCLKGYRFLSFPTRSGCTHRFVLSLRDDEDLLVERGIMVSYETIRHREKWRALATLYRLRCLRCYWMLRQAAGLSIES